MAKTNKTQVTDFDFSKRHFPTSSHNVIERIVAVGFVIAFGFAFFNTNNTPATNLDPIAIKPLSSETIKKYPDYVVTSEDKKLFESIFNYSNFTPVSKTTYSEEKFLIDSVRQDDIKNADFVNKNKNDKVTISSKILSIDSPDKNDMVKQSGFANLDYVDIVVEKTYQKGDEIYFEQQMVNLRLENHKIITINTNRMID